jgi:hypothetical protein
MKRNKYNNLPTIVDQIKFHSKKESARYSQLKLEEKAGLIKDLQLQVPFELIPKLVINGKAERAIKYIADFTYYDQAGNYIVEDVKGIVLDVFKLKYRLMKQVFGIDIKIT